MDGRCSTLRTWNALMFESVDPRRNNDLHVAMSISFLHEWWYSSRHRRQATCRHDVRFGSSKMSKQMAHVISSRSDEDSMALSTLHSVSRGILSNSIIELRWVDLTWWFDSTMWRHAEQSEEEKKQRRCFAGCSPMVCQELVDGAVCLRTKSKTLRRHHYHSHIKS